MAAKYLLWVTAAAACSTTRPAAPEAPDAGVDGWQCTSRLTYTPVTITGTSPLGSLDVFHYAAAGYFDGFCPPAYEIYFTTDGIDQICTTGPDMRLGVKGPFTSPGSNAAEAAIHNLHEATTDHVTFEATQLDQPDAMPPHIIGHFVSHDPGWSFDISVDLTSQFSNTCI